MPDGKIIQQPSTHLMGQKFSKAFNAKFKNKKGEEDYIWTTAYGPAISRILVSVISTHGDDKGLILPFSISPLKVIIVPIYNTKNKNKILKYCVKIKSKLDSLGIKSKVDQSEKRPGEKFNEWELKGVPFRLEIGEQELKQKKLTLFTRDTSKKEKISETNLKNISNLGKKFDQRLLKNADEMVKNKIILVKTKDQIKKIVDKGKIAKVDWCSTEKDGIKCANEVEIKMGADIMGTMANKKESPKGNCIICNKKASNVVYIGRSY